MSDDEITVEDAAALIGMHVGAIRRAIGAGRLPARRIGRRLYVIRREDAEHYRDHPAARGRPRGSTKRSASPTPANAPCPERDTPAPH